MVIALARTGQALGPALMLGTSNNLLSRSAVGSSRSRYSGDSHRFGYAAALCSTVAEFWWPDYAQHSMRGDPGVWRIWPSENQHWRETGNKELTTGSIQRSPAVRKLVVREELGFRSI